jgi:hypothetical protein
MVHNDYSEHKLQTAELLLNPMLSGYAPVNSAVSIAYYAVFHTLQFFIAQSKLEFNIEEGKDIFEEYYRKLNHKDLAQTRSVAKQENTDKDIIKILDNCRVLKEARIDADYKVPSKLNLTRSRAAELISLARCTIVLIRSMAANRDKLSSLVEILLSGHKVDQKKRSP